jgi:hypothetical protein
MLVSLAVLSLAMAVVGVVFSITTKTASQSAAYSEAHNWVRQFMQQIEEDLRYCDPANSVMVIVGRTQPAALTADGLAAGKHYRVLIGNARSVPAGYDAEYAADVDANRQYSDPRADILMFFTKRPTASVAPAPGINAADDPIAYAAAGGVKFSPVRVVYGHAALTDPVWTGSSFRFPQLPGEANLLQHIEQTASTPSGDLISKIPASRWHLGRVATIIVDPGISPPSVTNAQFAPGVGEWVALGQWYNGPFGQRMPGDVALLSMPALLDVFGPNANINYSLGFIPPLVLRYGLYKTSLRSTIDSLVYATGTASPTTPSQPHHVATVLNDVPAELAGNMGVHMLPGCAWFQVEFLMPEDPRNSVQYSELRPALGVQVSSRSDVPHWASAVGAFPGDAPTYVFVPDTAENRERIARNVNAAGQPIERLAEFARLDQDFSRHPQASDALSQRVIRLWPYAIRITVRVYDPNGRLDEPIVRTLVHRFE